MNRTPPLPRSLDLPFDTFDAADAADVDETSFDWDWPSDASGDSASGSQAQAERTQAVWDEEQRAAQPMDDTPGIDLYTPNDLHALNQARIALKDAEDRKQMQRLILHLQAHGCRRELGTLPDDWESRLDGLEQAMPNFADVIDILHCMLALCSVGSRSIHFDPLLLVGPPGVGKTLFAEKLAGALGMPMKVLRLLDAQSNAMLAGSERHWSNSKPGMLFDTLVYGKYANPLFFIDELDKAGHVAHGPDPGSALISLLEPGTARSFTDLCVPQLRLDASHICFMSAANDLETISEPVLSRFRIVQVPLPTPEQARQIVQAVVSKLVLEHLKGQLPIGFTETALAKLSTQSPRRMRILAKEAIGRALRANRTIVQAADIRSQPATARAIGFI